MATRLGEDLRTHIVGFMAPGRELARLSCASKGWHRTVTSFLPPSLARLAARCTELVLLEVEPQENQVFTGYQIAAISGFAGQYYWDPREKAEKVWETVYHFMCSWKAAFALKAPLLAFQDVHGEGKRLFIGDIRTGRIDCVAAPWAGARSEEQFITGLRFDQETLEAIGRRGVYEVNKQEGGWVVQTKNTLLHPESYFVDEEALVIDRKTRTLQIYKEERMLLNLAQPEMYVSRIWGAIDFCNKQGFYLVMALTMNRLCIYELEQTEDKTYNAKVKVVTPPFSSPVRLPRIQGERLIVPLENGQVFLLDIRTGKEIEQLALDWEGLEEPYREFDTLSRDKNRLFLALSTGSVQVFDLSRERDIRRACLKPPCPLTRIVALDHNSDELSRDFLALVRLMPKEGSVLPKFCVELWNLRTQCLLKRWEVSDSPNSVQLHVTAQESYLLVGTVAGEVRLMCSHQAALAHPSISEWLWESVCSWFSSICSFFQKLFHQFF